MTLESATMSPRPSSRLAKKEEKKLMVQIVWFVLIGVVILLAFVFLIMPAAIRLFFQFLDGNKGLEVSDRIPPQVPILVAPLDATNSATVALNGYAEANSKVIFVLNGAEISRVTATAEGTFTQDLRLETGENLLETYGADDAGNESPRSSTYKIFMDTEPVEIKIDEPTNGAQIEGRKNQTLIIKGTTKPDAKIYVNDRLNYGKPDGSFSVNFALSEGENQLKLRVVDKAGNQAESELTVHFRY